MLTLFHAPRSRSSRMIWLLEELGVDYEIRYVDIPRMDGSGQADASNPHPDRKVPALLHDDVLVTESTAICLYLTDLYPRARIGPLPGDPARGPYLSWLAYYSGVIEPVVTLDFAGLGDHPQMHRTFRGVKEMQARIRAALDDNPYLLGHEFSAADLLIGSVGQWARKLLPEGEPVDGYLARLAARPAVSRAAKRDDPPTH